MLIEREKMYKFILIGLVFLALILMQGCANTANGFGQLVQGIGQDVQDMAATQYQP